MTIAAADISGRRNRYLTRGWSEIPGVAAARRASELFDWLRSLPENHELAHLCDVYTYTTIISQCGSHQQLRKALELVAEMRGHGVVCNVHTYSALMNVCIKVCMQPSLPKCFNPGYFDLVLPPWLAWIKRR